MEKYDFIKFMLRSRNLSVNDKKRLVFLATQEIEKKENDVQGGDTNTDAGKKPVNKLQPHAPKDTAAFLALFNDPKGFKFLTHDFDPDSDMDYDKLMKQVRRCFSDATSKYSVPTKLWVVIRAFIYGESKKEKLIWRDFENKPHNENYTTDSWVEWAHKNPKVHLLSNEKFAALILKFRSSIRLVKPVLADIVKRQDSKHSDLIITTEGLEKADFYTYVWNLEDGMKRILDDMSRYSHKTPNVRISFERKFDDVYSLRIIKITQIGSVSSSLNDVLSRFHSSEGAGAFNEIKKVFLGYCNWSVEALWDGKPKRWNILSDSSIPEVEDLTNSRIDGFTHILTYFSK